MTISLSAADFLPTEMYFLLRDSIIPRPIAWVSTLSKDGASNIAPFSFFSVVSPYPPLLGFSCGPRGDNHNSGIITPKDTLSNILESGEFVVNIAPENLMDEMVKSAADLAPGDSEFAYANIVEAASKTVKPPRVAAAPVSYECKLYDIVNAGTNKWIMGSVEYVHIDESVYVGRKGEQNHRIDLLNQMGTRPVGRLGRANYVKLREVETRLRRDGPNA